MYGCAGSKQLLYTSLGNTTAAATNGTMLMSAMRARHLDFLSSCICNFQTGECSACAAGQEGPLCHSCAAGWQPLGNGRCAPNDSACSQFYPYQGGSGGKDGGWESGGEAHGGSDSGWQPSAVWARYGYNISGPLGCGPGSTCSGHGTCIDGTCECNIGFLGAYRSLLLYGAKSSRGCWCAFSEQYACAMSCWCSRYHQGFATHGHGSAAAILLRNRLQARTEYATMLLATAEV